MTPSTTWTNPQDMKMTGPHHLESLIYDATTAGNQTHYLDPEMWPLPNSHQLLRSVRGTYKSKKKSKPMTSKHILNPEAKEWLPKEMRVSTSSFSSIIENPPLNERSTYNTQNLNPLANEWIPPPYMFTTTLS